MAAAEIDAYLEKVPEAYRAALQALRETVLSCSPDLVEGVNYGVPAFKYRDRPLVSLGAAKDHCAFYVQSPPVMEAHATELEGFSTSKGTVRFQPDRPIPESLIRTLVAARMAETDAAGKKK